jgi:hypothetical protein
LPMTMQAETRTSQNPHSVRCLRKFFPSTAILYELKTQVSFVGKLERKSIIKGKSKSAGNYSCSTCLS